MLFSHCIQINNYYETLKLHTPAKEKNRVSLRISLCEFHCKMKINYNSKQQYIQPQQTPNIHNTQKYRPQYEMM